MPSAVALYAVRSSKVKAGDKVAVYESQWSANDVHCLPFLEEFAAMTPAMMGIQMMSHVQ